MGYRRALATLLATTTLLSGADPATAAGWSGYEVAYWPMDEVYGATRMVDTAGRGHHGEIGPEVETGVTLGGDIGYRFERLEPDTPPTRPGHLVIVAHHPDLDPGDNDYAVTLRLRTTGKFGNIIQKGQATVPGGNFKMQIPSGKVQCSFRGTRGLLEVFAPFTINDGVWHVVRCLRVQAGVALIIDGVQVAQRPGYTGPIANDWPITIGGKLQCDQILVGCDYYVGDLDQVTIESAPPASWPAG
ncbi:MULTISPECIES: LamG-like jellyroll fold domain-containing protein [Actinoplanes]|uniref:LamG-like jellyroll fold domain-containing protein n=1 Tax=Actinoplanes TaxID=1865 RepID=UPI0009FAE5F3|nr:MULTISPECIES: LamG-like jellyroll fold domain-containing protein [Actinoplanes]GLX99937.1 hypothetical protein Acsp01_03170 [Actinoplanes sp. NBRC 101535]